MQWSRRETHHSCSLVRSGHLILPQPPQEQGVLGNGINDRAAMSQWQFHAMEAEAGISGEQVAVSALRGGTLRHD